ncbi:zinc finger, CCHC-type containing protein [Tanacetum coccineum]
MILSIPMTFLPAILTEYIVSMVDGTMPLKGLILAEMRLLSTRFHVLAIILSFALTLGPLEVLFVGYAEHSKAVRIPNGTEGIGGSVVPEEVVQQPEPELRKSKRNRTPKNFGHEIQLYLIEGTRDEVSDQHSYCFNVEDDSKTFYKAMNSQDVDMTKEFLSSRFSMKDMGEADVIFGIKTKHESNGKEISQSHYIEKVVSQLEYSRVIGCLMYAMTCIRPDITCNLGYTDASWISNTEDNSSTSGCVFHLGGVAISLASKKQTCIIGLEPDVQWEVETLNVRHSLIRELIMNMVISIEFLRSQENLLNHLMKGLTRDLVIKSAEGMRLKSKNCTKLERIVGNLVQLWESDHTWK